MNNKENYKKALDQIHPSEELKQKTLENCIKNESKKNSSSYMKFLAACAMFILVFLIGNNYLKIEDDFPIENNVETNKIAKMSNSDLPRFKSMKELKDVLKKSDNYRDTNGLGLEVSVDSMKAESAVTESIKQSASNSAVADYSKTNIQVENVDEADIVKTDGEYIYYISDNEIFVIKADTLEILAKINSNDEFNIASSFSPNEIFVKDDVLVALGNEYSYEANKSRTITESVVTETQSTEGLSVTDVARVTDRRTAKAIVYDISDKLNPTIKREIELDGYYSNARMIGDNVYFISTKSVYYTNGMTDDEILPIYRDTVVSEEIKTINYTDIAYFEGTNNQSFTLIAGFNVNNQEEIFLETFFGASDTVYSSEENMYLAQVTFNRNYEVQESVIYKFNLENGAVLLQCKGEVKGDLNNQFAMDEYEGNLRIATTDYSGKETTNQVYILDKDLKQIGKIENMAPGEKIYSVRFIGKIGYVVTFKQIDPLFVIDLSDPTNPIIKGELKIPGYSSYLHPYDETHIIGIGYNTETNKYGGTTNTSMKMSMFDVSDLENPKEMFNIDIGNEYVYSEITSNHKALFYHKNKNLIGFPVTIRDYNYDNDTNNFMLYKIDLEKGFEVYGNIEQKIDYRTNIDRAIYIKDILYTLSNTQMVSYDLNTMGKLNILNFEDETNSEEISEIISITAENIDY